MKIGRALLCLALAALCACRRSEPPNAAERPAPRPPRLRIVTDRVSLETLEKVPLDDAVRLRPDVFRLRPDRRFLIALGELELLVTGAPNAQLHLAWTGKAWRIDSAGTVLGEIPEIAGYAEMRRLLGERAMALVATRRSAPVPASAGERDAIRKDCEAFDPAKQIEALKAIDRSWPATKKVW
jgi:hypothetical protein